MLYDLSDLSGPVDILLLLDLKLQLIITIIGSNLNDHPFHVLIGSLLKEDMLETCWILIYLSLVIDHTAKWRTPLLLRLY